jgi:hypothetical protein
MGRDNQIAVMEIYYSKCEACKYEIKIPLGSSDLDQILTDINADYADYHLFICRKESKFVHADIHDKTFEYRCPLDGSKLEEIGEISSLRCPSCNSDSLLTPLTGPMNERTDTLT